ncbi:hypothetical protein [Streptomyces sp. NPDC013457]
MFTHVLHLQRGTSCESRCRPRS